MSTEPHLVNLIIYACSILRSGVAVGGLGGRSNDELLRALSVTLDSALPPPAPTPTSFSVSKGVVVEGEKEEVDEGCWAIEGGGQDGKSTTVQIPDPEVDLRNGGVGVGLEDCCKEAKRGNLDVTAKFFYLSPPRSAGAQEEVVVEQERYNPRWTGEALKELERATGLESVDTLIVSLPGLTYDDRPSKGCPTDANADPEVPRNVEVTDEEMKRIWEAVSADPRVQSAGVSDFSKARLDKLYSNIPAATPQVNGHANGTNGTKPASTSLRRPRVNQINTRGDVPADLKDFAKAEDLKLFTHSDCSDILPPKTFALLLNKYAHRLPDPMIAALEKASQPSALGEAKQRDVRLQPRWVLKYTVLIKDRSVVADKGYIVSVSSV